MFRPTPNHIFQPRQQAHCRFLSCHDIALGECQGRASANSDTFQRHEKKEPARTSLSLKFGYFWKPHVCDYEPFSTVKK